MQQNNLASIVIATFNRADLVGETLKSIQEQTYTNWECIIVDDGSTDNTEEVVLKFVSEDSRIKFYKRPSDRLKGPNSSRNYGIENSQGIYIMSLDSDDWLLADYLRQKIEVLDNDVSIDGVLSKSILVNGKKEVLKEEKRTFLTDNLLEDFISLKVSWYMHDIIWRKSFLKDKMLYNEKLLKMLDRDFHIRRLCENPKLYLVDEYLALYRIHNNSNSSNSDFKVAETRHNAIMSIIILLKKQKKLSKMSRFYFFKHQTQNLVVLYKNPNCIKLYLDLIKNTFVWDLNYLKWILKLSTGYLSFKLTNRGLRFIQ